MFLGRGVENLLKDAGIDVSYCGVSLKNLGFNDGMVMPIADEVMGGVQSARKIDDGYQVIAF
jgi:hypothetical protein